MELGRFWRRLIGRPSMDDAALALTEAVLDFRKVMGMQPGQTFVGSVLNKQTNEETHFCVEPCMTPGGCGLEPAAPIDTRTLN